MPFIEDNPIKGYPVDAETVLAIGEFTIRMNLLEKFYFENNADDTKVLNCPVYCRYSSETEGYANRFRDCLLQYFSVKNQSINESGVNKLLFSSKRVYSEKSYPNLFPYLRKEIDDIGYCMLCIRRLRDNMLHGEKDVFCLNENNYLIQAANDVLRVLTQWNRCLDAQSIVKNGKSFFEE